MIGYPSSCFPTSRKYGWRGAVSDHQTVVMRTRLRKPEKKHTRLIVIAIGYPVKSVAGGTDVGDGRDASSSSGSGSENVQ